MSERLQLMLEAERRGILPEDKKPLLDEARKRGLVAAPEQKKDPMNPALRAGIRTQAYLTGGFDDEVYGAGRAAYDTAADIINNRPVDIGKRYEEGRDYARERKKEAFDESDRSWAGFAADTVADTAGLTGQAIATIPMIPQRTIGYAGEAVMPFAERLAFEMGKGTPQQVAAAATVEAVAPMTARQVAAESMRVGGAMGALNAYGESEGDLLEQGQDIAEGLVGGAALGRALPTAVNAADRMLAEPVRQWRRGLAREAGEVADTFRSAGIDPDTVYPPALTTAEPFDTAASNLSGTVFGGRLREGAQRSIADVERRLAEEIAAAGGRATDEAAGQDVQGLLRRTLTERSRPVEGLDQAQLQDISGVAPGPRYDPPPPTVPPAQPRQVKPYTADDVLAAAERGVPKAQPQYPPTRQPVYPREEVPSYRTPTIEEIPEPPAMAKERQRAIAEYDETVNRHNALQAAEDKAAAEAKELMGSLRIGGRTVVAVEPATFHGRGSTIAFETDAGDRLLWNPVTGMFDFPRTAPNPATAGGATDAARTAQRPSVQARPSQRAAISRLESYFRLSAQRRQSIAQLEQAANAGRQRVDEIEFNIMAERNRLLEDRAAKLRADEDARVDRLNKNMDRRRKEAEQVAKRLTETDRHNADLMAAAETAKKRSEARAAAEPQATQIAQARTDRRVRAAQRLARIETGRAQRAANETHAEEVARRRAQADRPFDLGRSRNDSYVTELDAAYEALARNMPGLQRNPLGKKNDPARNEIIGLLDSFAMEARRNNMLPGYKQGQVFDERGAVRSDLLDYMQERLGDDVGSRLRAFSEARATSRFTPGVQGIRDLRTAIGRAMEEAGSRRGDGETRPLNEAMLSRLYAALSDDMQAALRAAGPAGEVAAGQMRSIDEAYRQFIRELRIPLSKLYGENVRPEQAIAKLRKAASGEDATTLRQFYRVVDDKGDRLLATNAILANMLEGGLPGFLRAYRGLSPEARQIMFQGDARAYGEALDALAAAGGRLERFVTASRPNQRLRATVTNPGNLVTIAAGFLHLPTALAGAVGASAAARVMASPAMSRWLRKVPEHTRTQAWRRHVVRLRTILTANAGLGEDVAEQIVNGMMGDE